MYFSPIKGFSSKRKNQAKKDIVSLSLFCKDTSLAGWLTASRANNHGASW
jgi:hypothetical protein